VLAAIKRQPGITAARIAEVERISAPAMSNHLARMEKAGLIERTRGGLDKRRVGLSLTAEGEKVLRSVRQKRTAWLAARLDKLSAEERRAVDKAIAPLERLLEADELDAAPPSAPSHLRQSSPPLQLSPLLRRPADVGLRHVDAEHRARVARGAARAARQGPRARDVLDLPLRAFMLLGLFAGIVTDRYDNRRTVIVTQSVQMVFAAALAVFALTGHSSLAEVDIIAFLSGIAIVFDTPSRQSLTFQMVGRDELPNAVALNSSLFNTARIFGPRSRAS
jgi:Transcriptional regulators